MQLVKKSAIGLLVLVLSFGVFYLFQKDNSVKNDVLRAALSVFGDELFAMVPEGEQKAKLVQRYKDFIRKAENQQVSPQQVEHVAAGILNLTGQKTEIDAGEAIAALDFDHQLPGKNGKLQDPPAGVSPAPHPAWGETEREQLAHNLLEMHKLKVELDMVIHDSGAVSVYPNVLFTADSGLRVSISPRIKDVLVSHRHPQLEGRMERLEREKRLQWEQVRETEWVRFGLDSMLNEIPGLENVRIPFLSNTVVDILQTIDIDTLANMPPDSVEKFVKVRLSVNNKEQAQDNEQ